MDPQAAVRGTDQDAALSRLSCAKLGYLDDPFAEYFARDTSAPRPPLINVGTHARTWSVDQLALKFLATNPGDQKQIVSLGAGSDTRFFRLSRNSDVTHSLRRYVEIDFPESTNAKSQIISSNEALKVACGESCTCSETGVQSSVYNLIPGDLATLPDELGTFLTSGLAPLLDPSIDTLILAECVFIYLDPALSLDILRWSASTFHNSFCILYDPVRFDDAFGQVMIRNLRHRHISLPGASVNTSPANVAKRLRDAGFTLAQAEDVSSIRKRRIPSKEKARIASLELVDEYEELDLVLAHYTVAWATNASHFQSISLHSNSSQITA